MPVFGEPTPAPPAPAESPPVTRVYGTPVPAKQRSLAFRRSHCVAARVQMSDAQGDPTDMTAYTLPQFTAALSVREALRPTREPPRTVVGALTQVADVWHVEADVPREVVNLPGVYLAEAGVTDDTLYPRCSSAGETVTSVTRTADAVTVTTEKAAGAGTAVYVYPAYAEVIVSQGRALGLREQIVRDVCLVTSSTVYLLVERGLFGATAPQALGPPTRDEIRLALRDYPEGNLLLDEYEFDSSEIGQALVMAVDWHNVLPPPAGPYFDTTTFPYRALWMEGAIARLFRTAAAWHRRNRLDYSAGGVSVQDLNKEQEYLKAAEDASQRFVENSKLIKVRQNCESFYGSIASDYSRWRWG